MNDDEAYVRQLFSNECPTRTTGDNDVDRREEAPDWAQEVKSDHCRESPVNKCEAKLTTSSQASVSLWSAQCQDINCLPTHQLHLHPHAKQSATHHM